MEKKNKERRDDEREKEQKGSGHAIIIRKESL
jgi:hypothetical protein